MTLVCGVRDSELARFTDGGAVELENHVATCEHCQGALDTFWAASFERDLAPSVLRTLEFDEFVMDATEMALGVGASLLRAAMTYLAALTEEEEQ